MLKKVILVWANYLVKEDLLSRPFPTDYEFLFSDDAGKIKEPCSPVAYFILDESLIRDFPFHELDDRKPIFVNDVCGTFDLLPAVNCLVRINAWPGFLRHPLLELSAQEKDKDAAAILLADLDWPFRWVADIRGLVTPRTIAMLINEACFAINQKISTPMEIDIALKLGTSYPKGPFEWAKQIGPDRIFQLLTALSAEDERYKPAPFLLENLQSFS
ncbi:MAG: 3-hydroxyacyl-CoA dehydrogenase family protein [Chitinophagaceae bacterium]